MHVCIYTVWTHGRERTEKACAFEKIGRGVQRGGVKKLLPGCGGGESGEVVESWDNCLPHPRVNEERVAGRE